VLLSAGASAEMKATDLDLEVPKRHPPRSSAAGDDGSRALLYDIVRKRPTAPK
jgi:hypothetical protein